MLLTSALVFVYARPYLRDRGLFVGEYYVLCLFAVLGMMLLVSAGNLVMVYLGLELLALSSYATGRAEPRFTAVLRSGHEVLRPRRTGLGHAALRHVHDLRRDRLAGSGPRSTRRLPKERSEALLLFGVVFVVVGLAFKFGAAYRSTCGCPTSTRARRPQSPRSSVRRRSWPRSAWRIACSSPVSTASAGHWQLMLTVAGGAVARDRQHRGDHAEQSQAHAGLFDDLARGFFLFLGLVNGQPEGYAAAMFYAISYALTARCGLRPHPAAVPRRFRGGGNRRLQGPGPARDPWYAFLMALTMFSLAGVPPLFGFFGKLLVLKAVAVPGTLWLAIAGAVFAIIGIYYYLRIVKVMYFDDPAEGCRCHPQAGRRTHARGDLDQCPCIARARPHLGSVVRLVCACARHHTVGRSVRR